MAVTLDEARALKASLEEEHRERHQDFYLLRKFWKGEYWQVVNSASSSLGTLFRDERRGSNITAPEMLIVHNLLQEICVKYQTYLSTLPMISVYTDPPSTRTRRQQAERKERFLYGVWDMGNMLSRIADAAWYLPLFGHGYLGCFPDFDRRMATPIIRTPEFAYPISSYDGQVDAVIFCWKIPENVARRDFPKYEGRSMDPKPSTFTGRIFGRRDVQDDTVEVLEYSDKKCWYRWVGDTQVSGVEHDFGWNVFDEIKFINVPGEPWGHGAVEQYVSMVNMGNHLYSLLMHNVMANVFPALVLEDPSKLPEEIDFGPGGVIPVNPGGGAQWLHPPVQALGAQMGFLEANNQMIKQGSGMPDSNFGVSHASIQTGKAINELQNAASGNTVEMVQSIGLGLALVNWNQKAIEIQRNLFRDDKVALYVNKPNGIYSLTRSRETITVKGSELIGSTRNDVVWMPYLNQHEKLVMNLQAMGGGLVSKQYSREQMGIPDSEAMDEEIMGEILQDAVLQSITQAMITAGATPEAATEAETQATAYMAGGTHLQPAVPAPGQAPAPGLPVGGPGPMAPPAGALPPGGAPPGAAPPGGGGPPIGPIGPGAPGQAMSPALQLPEGAPPPGGALAPAPGGLPPEGLPPGGPAGAPPEAPAPEGVTPEGEVSLTEVTQAIAGLTGIQGQVWLVGAIVDHGSTAADIEIDITVPEDQQTISDGLPQWSARFNFHVVGGTPDENNVEVTPGAQGALPGGGPPPEGMPPEGAAGAPPSIPAGAAPMAPV